MYEGWKNYETWNCALWINNDYPLYLSATLFMKAYNGAKPYRDWVHIAGLENATTKDGCSENGKHYLNVHERVDKGIVAR